MNIIMWSYFGHFSLSIEAFLHMYIWETDLRYSSSFALRDQVQEGTQKQVRELEQVEQSDWATPIMVQTRRTSTALTTTDYTTEVSEDVFATYHFRRL